MANFCVKCGSPMESGPFCTKCGTDARTEQQSIQAQPAPQTAPQSADTPPTATGTTQQPSVPRKGMSTLAKLGVAAVGVIFVGGAAGAVGLYYVGHRVSQKVHQAEDRILGSSSDAGGDRSAPGDSTSGRDSTASHSDNSMGDVCRFLSKEEVSNAIGIAIVRTESVDGGCNYFAKGTQADITAKHAAAMMASRGADQKTQQLVQNIAGGMFKALAPDKPPSAQDKTGEVLVFNFSVDQHSAEEQMRLNAKALATLGDTEGLPGIGDQAFVSADGMIMVRKGKSLIRIMYLTCPCGTEQVKPLAKKLGDSL
ncbi:MAG TPA: hypothetical protein VMH89_05060 [Candidatus Acidoferrum sp.]|nr:hypothetical protein [Candidatus Acidoferrum sp.]